VLARVRLTLYEPRGIYQVSVQSMEPLGVGSLQLAFEQLKEKLGAEGLFDARRKKPIPVVPRRVGIVTSLTGAAIRDILRVLERRGAGLDVLIAPCLVQGKSAAPQIAEALHRLNEMACAARGSEERIDVLIVTRGGGSLEDLWPFNEQIVARAIASSDVPVISAVGHETDVTIADFVADLRAATPSAAAEIVIKSREELASHLSGMIARLQQAIRIVLLRHRGVVQDLRRSRAFAQVEAALAQALQRCDEATLRLGSGLRERLAGHRERLRVAVERLSPRSLRAEVASRRGRLAMAGEILVRAVAGRLRRLREETGSLEGLLTTLSPLAVLERGYAICQDESTGAIIRAASDVMIGDPVGVRLARGRLEARVTRTENDDPAPWKEQKDRR
jgi:exodeoxyribonuclease VII large subunit